MHMSGGLFLFNGKSWRDVTPASLGTVANKIDDVTFSDQQHGWIAAYDGGDADVYLYRTTNGGRSWQSLGKKAGRSPGGGPTYLSFVDAEHGWMEPLEPNAPGGELMQTADGGRTWKSILQLVQFESSSLPCLSPIEFISRSVGWVGRCNGHVYTTSNAGRRWHRVVAVSGAPKTVHTFDMPRFSDKAGAMAAILGDKRASKVAFLSGRASKVAFFSTANHGRTWAQRALRGVASCSLRVGGGAYQTFWPTSIASPRVWWIVSGRKRVTVQVTRDAGRHWSSVVAKGLPTSTCAMTSTSAANARVAWAIASFHSGYNKQLGATMYSSALYQTTDGGRNWKRVQLTPRVHFLS